MAKRRIIKLIRVLVFLLLFLFLYLGITKVYILKSEEELTRFTVESLTKKYDAYLIGPSTIMDGVYPLDLWKETGILAFNLGSGAQSICMSYYLAREAIEKDHPRLIVLDCGRAFLDEKTMAEVFLHYLTDTMPFFSRQRIHMIADIAGESTWQNYVFPLNAYHTRWKEAIDRTEFSADVKNDTYGAKIEGNHTEQPLYEYHEVNEDDAIGATSRIYLDKIVELCRTNETDLLLITLPFPAHRPDISQEEFDLRRNAAYALEGYAADQGVEYLNLLDSSELLGIDYTKDSYDGEHLSYTGARKLTSYLGTFIKEHFDVPDRRTDQKYAFVEKDYEKYQAIVGKRLISGALLSEDYFMFFEKVLEMKRDDYLVIIAVKDIIGDYVSDEMAAWMQSLGLEKNLQGYGWNAYIAVVDGGEVLYEELEETEDLPLLYTDKTATGHTISVVSKPFACGNEVRIIIDDRDYAVNSRGINIIVYDRALNSVIDTAAVDTFTPSAALLHGSL